MRKRFRTITTRVAAFSLALYMLATPAFAIVREVEVFGARSINDLGDSDHRITMDSLKEDYHDFVQTDTLREYFHQDKDAPSKVDLDQSLSWLVDNNIISRDTTITVSNVRPNQIPKISIDKYDVNKLKALNLTRTDLIMYMYKAVYGPINARTIAVETDNIRVDDGEYITLYDLMVKNGYNPDPNTHLPGSGQTIIPGSNGSTGGNGGGAGSPGGTGGSSSGGNHQTNYLDDFGNWRYQPQGDLWESIFGDTNIFISQNNFLQQITGGNGGPGGGGGAGVGGGGGGGSGSSSTGNQDLTNNTINGDYNSPDSNDTFGNANTGNGGTGGGTGSTGDYNTNTGGGGGGGGAGNTGDNFIDYDTDYKQIYFIPGADMMFYENNEVPEVYIQAALSRGLLSFESGMRSDKFNEEFVKWPEQNKNKRQSWEKNSPAYVVNRSKNILRTVTDTEQVATQFVLGTSWNVSWQNSTLTLNRPQAFQEQSGYFTSEFVSKMDVYRYVYYFVYDAEKSLSELERDIVNYKYGMELDGITNEADTNILKYLIAKGILCYDNTHELVELAAPMSWSDFLVLLRRVADKDFRLDFSLIQLTDSEAQWKAAGYAPQTQHLIAGDDLTKVSVMSTEDFYSMNFGTGEEEGNTGTSPQVASFRQVASESTSDGRTLVRFGEPNGEKIVVTTKYGALRNHGITTNFEGALYNTMSDNGDHLGAFEGTAAGAQMFDTPEPSSNIAKYALSLVYHMVVDPGSTAEVLQATYPSQSDNHSAKARFATDILCNLWAITDMRANSSAGSEIKKILDDALTFDTRDTQAKTPLSGREDAFKKAINDLLTLYSTYCTGGEFAPSGVKFMFYIGDYEQVVTNWSQLTNGDIETVVNRIEGLQFSIELSTGRSLVQTYKNVPIGQTSVRGHLAQTDTDFIKGVANKIDCTISTDLEPLVGDHWTDEMKSDAVSTFGNGVSSFAVLDSVANTPDILTYVDPDTNEAFIAWSTLERYKQSYEQYGDEFPIRKISDYVLYNESSNTYAYFSEKSDNDTKIALVGTDVVSSTSDRGVVYREGSEVYYLVDAVRLLMDAKQAAEILGSLRSMPLASTVIQSNIRSVKLDDNTGVNSTSLTGITVLLSDDDKHTTEQPNFPEDSVYFHKTTVYNNLRWGDFFAISNANRAINATSRRFAYTTASGEKKSAYAVVIFEPLPEEKLNTPSVSPDSSLQDLLDSPQRVPESQEGKASYEANMELCNAFANWIYNTKGKQYINTGYLLPHAYIYAVDTDVIGRMPQAEWGSLTAQQRGLVEMIQFKNVTSGGVIPFGSDYSKWDKHNIRTDLEHSAGYLLATDYTACVLGDRLYLNLGCFKNITTYTHNNQTVLHSKGLVLGASAFTVGSTFQVKGYNTTSSSIDGSRVPTVTVMATESDGTVTCQVGPVCGVPLIFNGTKSLVIRGYPDKKNGVKTFGDYDWESEENDLLMYVYRQMFGTHYVDISYEGISKDPYLTASTTRKLVFDGSSMWRMGGSGMTKIEDTADYASQGAAYMKTGCKVSDLVSSVNNLSYYKNKGVALSASVETYFIVKFNAFYYTLENGVLTYAPNQASDFISPSLFTSMNDLIIDEMIDADNGAIPLEELPFDSILKIGTGHYAVSGTSAEDMCFIGYAPLDIQASTLNRATVQDVAMSYATHFIKVGNQSVNISHFFNTIEVLQSFGTDQQQRALNIVRDGMFVGNKQPKVAIFGAESAMGAMSYGQIMEGNAYDYTLYYSPVEITFQRGLLKAYQTSAQGETPVVYTIVSHANQSVTGPLSDLPFFSDNAMSGGLLDRTVKMTSGGFIRFYGASDIMNEIRAQFQRGFAGDLFTLTRMLVFIVLIWLVVASWMCYATYFGGLMPILDAIRYPTGSRQGKGIDLMKIVSLGSITMETDFKLGRFIQYNLVLGALISVIYLAGIYL